MCRDEPPSALPHEEAEDDLAYHRRVGSETVSSPAPIRPVRHLTCIEILCILPLLLGTVWTIYVVVEQAQHGWADALVALLLYVAVMAPALACYLIAARAADKQHRRALLEAGYEPDDEPAFMKIVLQTMREKGQGDR
ncbi:MAG: hypothetical protein GF320_03240 [Armatimonadia bacterium]|nr:hypothetical protein [Armatimonadia bacterium]